MVKIKETAEVTLSHEDLEAIVAEYLEREHPDYKVVEVVFHVDSRSLDGEQTVGVDVQFTKRDRDGSAPK